MPMYHGVPRGLLAGLFYTPDMPQDLRVYDEEKLATVMSRVTGVDVMLPGAGAKEAAQITCPVFLAFGTVDVSPDPHAEPAAYRKARDVTLFTVPQMAHMHNFADTRKLLWERFYGWLAVALR
jgi:pimeloyl-ACP methyl ester carboxylesterase